MAEQIVQTQPAEPHTLASGALGWLCLVTIGLACGSYFLIDAAPLAYADPPWLTVLLQLILIGFVATFCLLFVLPLAETLRYDLAVAAISVFFVSAVALTLKNTPFTVGGYNGDARLYTAFVTKIAVYGGAVDFVYRDLPPFYPPFYFWLVGYLARFCEIEPYRLMKPMLLATMTLLPFLSTWLWRRIVDRRLAVAPAFLLLVVYHWFRPHEWLALVLFVPWWLHWVEGVNRPPAQPRQTRIAWWLIGSLIGAIIFQSYYYWFFVGAVKLIVNLCFQRLEKIASRELGKPLWQNASMLFGTALFSLGYWAPYLYSMYATGGWNSLQNRWLSDGYIPLPLPFLEASGAGLVFMAGLLYLLLTWRELALSRSLFSFVIAIYSWIILGYAGMLFDVPLVTYRLFPMLNYMLALGAFVGLIRLWQYDLWRRVSVGLTLALLLLFGQEVVRALQTEENVQDARTAHYPSEQLAALDRLTQNEYLHKEILVSSHYREVTFFRPLFSFLAWSAHFSHPAGRFHDRIDFLQKLGTVHSPVLFAAALMNNRYSPHIDYILLKPEGDLWRLQFTDDNFPAGALVRDLYFPKRLLVEPYFQTRVDGNYQLLLPVYEANPLAALSAEQLATAPLSLVADVYATIALFEAHLTTHHWESMRSKAVERLQMANWGELPLENLLDLYAVGQDMLKTKAAEALMAKLSQPAAALLVDQTGAAKLRVLGYTIAQQADGATKLALYLETLAPLPLDYTLWLHGYRDNSKVTFDHPPAVPSTSWQPGRIYVDIYTMQAEPGAYEFAFGLWEPEQDIRLTQPSGDFGIVLGTYAVK